LRNISLIIVLAHKKIFKRANKKKNKKENKKNREKKDYIAIYISKLKKII